MTAYFCECITITRNNYHDIHLSALPTIYFENLQLSFVKHLHLYRYQKHTFTNGVFINI